MKSACFKVCWWDKRALVRPITKYIHSYILLTCILHGGFSVNVHVTILNSIARVGLNVGTNSILSMPISLHISASLGSACWLSTCLADPMCILVSYVFGKSTSK
jgi:hypothetical protein